ncbi:hypothetical protein ACA910_001736 [Epithemia clementina (nom. ined.)]
MASAARSYATVLEYLEEDFLRNVGNPAATAAAELTTPLRQKPVGDVDLLRQKRRQREQQHAVTTPRNNNGEDDSSKVNDNQLGEMSRTLVKHLESSPMLSSGCENHEYSDLNIETLCRLLDAVKQSMECIISLTSSRKMKLYALETLLEFAMTLVESMDLESQSLSGKAQIDVASMVCQVFRHLEKVPFERHTTEEEMRIYSACFCSCLRYLSKMILLVSSSSAAALRIKGAQRYQFQQQDEQQQNQLAMHRTKRLEELYNLLEDFQIVQSIIHQHRPYDRRLEVSSNESRCVLNFFSLLVTCGDAKMLSFLVVDEIAPLLNAILRAASPPPDAIRGYKPRGLTKVGWEQDPKHENSIRAYQFLAVLLRAVTDSFSTPKDRKLKHKCFDRALHCLNCNVHVVRGCLRHVSNAVLVDIERHMGAGHSRFKGLTIQLLREASAILTLVAELCSHDMFRQKYAQLYKEITVDARKVVLGLCSFLGAAGIARELFHAMADLEKGNGGSLSGDSGGPGGTSARLKFSPVIDVFLRSGRNNTRHEAIQFSHFVSGCSAAVSSDELRSKNEFSAIWMPSSGSSTDNSNWLQQTELTESSLEQNSRCALTNKFAFALELEAGKCLLQAANTLWETHPATTSFVEFTPDEIAKIRNDISWIKVRDIVAFRQDDLPYGMTCLGEVVYVDTFNLQFQVRPVDEKENHRSVAVPLHRLAGVEDRAKRQGTFAFAHAPETSSDLHRSRAELSLGHLILAMRWCHEYSFEEEQQGFPRSPWAHMNARILSMLLVKEIELHLGSNNVKPVAPPEMRMLRAQLLDLFGESEEYASFFQGYNTSNMREKGRLGDLISQPFWEICRNRLDDELNEAIRDILAVQLEESKKVHRVLPQYSNGFVYNH